MGTHDATTNGNGTLPLEATSDPLAPYIEGLERELAPLAARRAQLESEVAEILKNEARIKAGITALKTGAPKRPSSATTKASSQDWAPSQKTVDDVYAALARSDEPLSVTQLAEAAEISRGTVSKAIDVLRSQERVRLVGNAATAGSPKIYAVMQ